MGHLRRCRHWLHVKKGTQGTRMVSGTVLAEAGLNLISRTSIVPCKRLLGDLWLRTLPQGRVHIYARSIEHSEQDSEYYTSSWPKSLDLASSAALFEGLDRNVSELEDFLLLSAKSRFMKDVYCRNHAILMALVNGHLMHF